MNKSDLYTEYIELTIRFLSALDALSQQKVIRGRAIFVKKYGLDLRNFYKVLNHKIRNKPEWLVYLVQDYKVSPDWMLMGRGGMFTK